MGREVWYHLKTYHLTDDITFHNINILIIFMILPSFAYPLLMEDNDGVLFRFAKIHLSAFISVPAIHKYMNITYHHSQTIDNLIQELQREQIAGHTDTKSVIEKHYIISEKIWSLLSKSQQDRFIEICLQIRDIEILFEEPLLSLFHASADQSQMYCDMLIELDKNVMAYAR
ncbi:MAG TPA: hypothetical protein PKA06_10190 [Gemmatales bacterium]|nr:hypothetical protein [Gemmatales bacterium]